MPRGLLAQLTKAVVERALGYAQGGSPTEAGNCRNGTSAQTMLGEGGKVPIAVPWRSRGTFAPRLIAKGQRHFEGFDERSSPSTRAG
jgi:putative transposase